MTREREFGCSVEADSVIIKLVSACGGKIERSLDFPWWLVFGPDGARE